MRRAAIYIFIVLLAGSASLMAQSPSVGEFLEGVSVHPVGDGVEQDQGSKVYQAVSVASPAELETVLPNLLKYTRSGNEVHARRYATLFLTALAIRPDGADLLSSNAENISSLIVDADPGIQKAAVTITDWVISKPQTNKQPYLAALLAAIQKPQTPQDVSAEIASPLLIYGSANAIATKSVLDFLHRNDLTESTRMDILRNLAGYRDLPKEVRQSLVYRLDDPSLRVRAAAVIAFSNPLLGYDPLARERVERIARDQKEDFRLRALAKEALAGHSPLNPNIDLTPYKPIVVND